MKRCISIENRKIGDGQPVFVIAEAGVNHNGSLKRAKGMIDVAKSAGADAVKFQTFKTEELVTYYAPKADYQKKNTAGKSQFEMLKGLELPESAFAELFSYCKKKKIIFLSTPFDSQSADFLYKLGVSAFKIGSGDLTNIPLLLGVAEYQRPMFLSTGMATLQEVKRAVEAVYSADNRNLILLHCTSSYPVRYKDVNLKAMLTLMDEFDVPVGYSDHTEGFEVSVAAVAMSACVIERHFTLNKDLPGPDHKASLEPDELKKAILSIRNIQDAMGDGVKMPQRTEGDVKRAARKSIVASCDIPKGVRITEDMLAAKRPGTGIGPEYIDRVAGGRSRRDIKKDQLLTWAILR